VFYDQLGCGKSDIPDDDSLWTPERFAREVQAVRDGLGLDRVHLLGHSWGGWLALEYVASKPRGVVSLTLASTSASVQAFVEAVPGLLAGLPPDVQDTIARCEKEGATESPEYQAASLVFYQNYLCRVQPWPEPLLRSMGNIQATPVYSRMWGPSEFTLTGTLRGWDRTGVLREIDVPTLITAGRYDEAIPPIAEDMHRRIKGSRLVIFEESSHSAHVEEPERFTSTLRDFMPRAEAAA
jgi:proline-specific peptidase